MIGFSVFRALGGMRLAAEDHTPDYLIEPTPPAAGVPQVPSEVAAMYGMPGMAHHHVCLPDCPGREPPYLGPVIQGRRCQVCGGPDGPECGPCHDAIDRDFERRQDR